MRGLVAGLLVGAATFGAVPLAHATFGGGASASSSFSSASLAGPTSLSATKRCTFALLVLQSASLDLTWTPSTSSWATGQSIVVRNGLGVVVWSDSVGASVSSVTAPLPPLAGGTYTATVAATYRAWTSPPASASSSGC